MLVSRLCGSINARARSVHFKTAHDGRSHTFSKLRTLGRGRPPRGPLLRRGVLYEKKNHEVAYLFYRQHPTIPSTIRRGTLLGIGTRDSLRISTFYALFSHVTDGPAPRKCGPFVEENTSFRGDLTIVSREEITFYYWMTIIRVNDDRFLFRAISMESILSII